MAATIIQGRLAPQPHPFLRQANIEAWVVRLVNTVAYRQGVLLNEHDREDAAQNAWERLIPAFARFDARRGTGASLLTRTVTNATKSWLTARIAQIRDVRLSMPLPRWRCVPAEHGEDGDLGSDEDPWNPLFPRRDEQRQLAADLWGFVLHLPDDLREFITTLAAERRRHTRTRRALGLNEDQYEALLARAQTVLADAGLTGLP